MSTDTALTTLTWILAALAAATLVGIVLVRRWAARILVLAIGALLIVTGVAARVNIASLATDNPEALCRSGASWFGLHLTGPDEVCVKYR